MSIPARIVESESHAVAGRRRVRVLVVDTDAAELESLRRRLESSPDVMVVTVSSARDVMLRERPEAFDLCLVDRNLGDVDGVTLGAMIRSLNPVARVILTGTDLSPRVELLAREHGFHSVLRKPLRGEDLERVVVEAATG